MKASGGSTVRIIVGTSVLLCSVLIAALVLSARFAERIGREQASEELTASTALRRALQLQRFQELGLLAEIMAGRVEFRTSLRSAMAAEDQDSVLARLEARRAELGYDLALVVGADGRLAARTDEPLAAGEDLSSRALIARVRERFESAGVWRESERLYDAVAVPMAVDDELFGFLALGYEISDLNALEVRRSSGAETIYVSGEERLPVASSLTPAETERVLRRLDERAEALDPLDAGNTARQLLEVRLGEERWLVSMSPLLDAADAVVGRVISLAAVDRSPAEMGELRENLLGVAAVSGLVVLLLAFLAARRMAPAPAGGSVDLKGGAVVAPASPEIVYGALAAIRIGGVGRPRAGLVGDERPLSRIGQRTTVLESTLEARGGRIAALHGDRLIAVFDGNDASRRALDAVSELLRADAGEESEPPSAALAVGPIGLSSLRWKGGGGPLVLGLPLDEAEAMLREAGPGEVALSRGAVSELAAAFAEVGLEPESRSALLSSRTFFVLESGFEVRSTLPKEPEEDSAAGIGTPKGS